MVYLLTIIKSFVFILNEALRSINTNVFINANLVKKYIKTNNYINLLVLFIIIDVANSRQKKSY